MRHVLRHTKGLSHNLYLLRHAQAERALTERPFAGQEEDS